MRTSADLDIAPGYRTLSVKEQSYNSPNTPESKWFHVITSEGEDGNFATQLALGMTSKDMYFRNKQNGTWGQWNKIIQESYLSHMIPFLYKFATATQPLFVISKSSEDTVYCNGRGVKRNSSESAFIFKCNGHSLKSMKNSSGFAIMSSTESAVSCTGLTEYSNVHLRKFQTPAGNTAYVSEMSSKWTNASFNVITTVDGTQYTIKDYSAYLEETSFIFLLSMADFYLF